MKTITAYAVIDKDGEFIQLRHIKPDMPEEHWVIVELTGEYDDTPKLKQCPCGKTPTLLDIYKAESSPKWAYLTPNCCSEWSIEFRTIDYDMDSLETMKEAHRVWNNADRGWLKNGK